MRVCNSIKTIILSLTFVIILLSTSYAADSLYRFTHNDQDMLIIGQVESIDKKTISVKVLDRVVSKSDLNISKKKEQLVVDNATIKRDSIYADITFNTGDYILASLNKEGNSFVNANGVYKVDSANKSTLVILEPNTSVADNKAVECFIHSDGTITEFYFEYDKAAYRDENGNEIVVYDSDNSTEILSTTISTTNMNDDTIIDIEDGKIVEKKVTIRNIIPTLIAIIVLFIVIILCRVFIIGKKRK